ncbi:MAG: hypothetical protein AB7G17_12310 [Phycisphaerales bacterium]
MSRPFSILALSVLVAVGGLLGRVRAGEEGAPSAGAAVVVMLKDGSRLTGELVRSEPGRYVVRVAGVELRIDAGDVERVVAQRPLAERYREMRGLIDDADAPRLLELVDWLRSNGLLDEALGEVDHVLRLDPTHVEAARMREEVLRQIELREKAREAPGGEWGEARGREPAVRAPEIPLLTDEQVNLIKVYEIDLDRPPKFVVDRTTVERLLREYADSPLIPTTREGREEFLRLPATKIMDVMFRVQARDLYREVRVEGQPESMRRFRDDVNRAWLATTCASTACHGGDKAGEFRLAWRRTTHERSFGTNFLIVQRARLKDGTPLINYEEPERSPLLQLGLLRHDSLTPHPEVAGWSPVFRTMGDRRFLDGVSWIESLYRPRPEVPIVYPPKEEHGAGAPVEEKGGGVER